MLGGGDRALGEPLALAHLRQAARFFVFRGFVAVDPARKAELYREALRFNPTDHNVRDLLSQLEGGERGSGG